MEAQLAALCPFPHPHIALAPSPHAGALHFSELIPCMRNIVLAPWPPGPAHLPQQEADVGEDQRGPSPGPHRAAALLNQLLLLGSQTVAVTAPKPGNTWTRQGGQA